jgi:hypothetical protein
MTSFILNQNENKPCPILTRPAIIIVNIVNILQITKTILARLAIDILNELILMSITEKKERCRHCLLKEGIDIQMVKIANILTSSSGGPQSKYAFILKILIDRH